MERHQIDLDESVRAPKPTISDRIKEVMQRWPQACDERVAGLKKAVELHFEDVQDRYRGLYNTNAHYRLRDAIVSVVGAKRPKKTKR